LTSVRDLDDTADKTGSASPRPATPPQPSRWLSHPSPLRVVAALAVLVAIGVGIWDSQERDILSGIGTAVATLIAVAVAVLALSIRHGSPEGFLLGFGIAFIGMVAWTHPAYLVWAMTGVVGLVAVVWTFPWWRDWRSPLRLGGFWVGAPLWAYGVLGAIGVGAFEVAVERLVYGGYALAVTLLVVQAVRRRGRDVTVGIAAGLLLSLALLLAAGCQYVFETTDRYTATNNYGAGQGDRFWGGPLLVFHPNATAMMALLAAMRLGPEYALARWQRYAALAVAAFSLYLTGSRTAMLVALFASGVYALLVIWRAGLPRWRFWSWLSTRQWRRIVGRALIPFALTCLVVGITGGSDLMRPRYSAEEQTEPRGVLIAPRWLNTALSGRPDVWSLIFEDFVESTVVEQALGTGDNTRGTIERYPPGHPEYEGQTQLGADNAFVAALRRSGAVGALTALVGLIVILWHTTRRHTPIWAPIIALAAAVQCITEDELVSTTVIWVMLLGVESWVVFGRSSPSFLPHNSAGPSLQSVRNTESTP